jgi:hypothetical protein
MKKMWRLTAIACAYTVAGCGGGGDGGAGATTLAFPLAKGYAALIVAGEATTFDVSGTCSGIATLTSNPATTASFDGEPMLAVADTKTLQLVNCTPSTSSSSWTNYYDLQFALAGSVSAASTVYGFVPTPRQPLPDTVRVGDSGIRETLFVYTDSSKTALYGRTERSYLVPLLISEWVDERVFRRAGGVKGGRSPA